MPRMMSPAAGHQQTSRFAARSARFGPDADSELAASGHEAPFRGEFQQAGVTGEGGIRARPGFPLGPAWPMTLQRKNSPKMTS